MARTTAEKPAPDDAETAAAEEPVEEPAADASEESVADASEEPAEDAAEEPVEQPAEDAAEEPVEQPAADASEEPAGDASEEPAGDAAAETAAESDDVPEAPGVKRRFTRDPLLLVAVALTVIAAACAGYFARSWYAAAHDDSLAYSRDRDAALRAAEQGVQNMNTLDYRKVDQGLTSWEDSSTGDLRQELVQGRAQFASQVRQARTVTTAKILDGAVTELDDRAGKAGAIVAVQITVTPPSGAPTTKQSRMRAQLTRTPAGWKLSALGQAPLGSTAG